MTFNPFAPFDYPKYSPQSPFPFGYPSTLGDLFKNPPAAPITITDVELEDLTDDIDDDWDDDDDAFYFEDEDGNPENYRIPKDEADEPGHSGDDSYILRPDYIGVVTGAQAAQGDEREADEYGLVFVDKGEVYIVATTEDDLRVLADQIKGTLD